MIDSDCKPWLLEVNQSPSFSTDSPLDYLIKKHVLGDAFRLLNVSFDKKMDYLKQLREEAEKRIYQGRTSRLNLSPFERRKLREDKLKERFDFEKGREGGYELIFPVPGEGAGAAEKNRRYEAFIKKANDLWDEFTTGRKPGGGEGKQKRNSQSNIGQGEFSFKSNSPYMAGA